MKTKSIFLFTALLLTISVATPINTHATIKSNTDQKSLSNHVFPGPLDYVRMRKLTPHSGIDFSSSPLTYNYHQHEAVVVQSVLPKRLFPTIELLSELPPNIDNNSKLDESDK